ncbi:MAG: hypothetical protein NC402_01265 [Prevotella sp.]|nr:hypothetical protein [Prevotella sp.]MCM1074492.1 hypothetical protein [Ruminococcus sp.]
MNVSDILTYPREAKGFGKPGLPVSASMSQVLAAMVNEQSASVSVSDDLQTHTLTDWQMLQALGHMLPYNDECSEIEITCPANSYSASALTLAAEDADAPVLSLLAYPADAGMLNVYLRINRSDPSQAVRSLERHGFTVTNATGAEYADAEMSRERWEELQHYLNI